jgi:hypothetical protein
MSLCDTPKHENTLKSSRARCGCRNIGVFSEQVRIMLDDIHKMSELQPTVNQITIDLGCMLEVRMQIIIYNQDASFLC